MPWKQGTLKSVFWSGLDDPLFLQAPAATTPGTLTQYIDNLLLLDDSSFTVGEVDEDDDVTQLLTPQPPSVLLVPSVYFSEPISVLKSIPVSESPIPESHSEMATTLVPLGVLVEYEGMSWNLEWTPVPKFNPDFAHIPKLRPELTY